MRTEIATLGEFGLIDRLTEGIKLENESSKYGVGDDAAVLSYPSEKHQGKTRKRLHLFHEGGESEECGLCKWSFSIQARR